MTGGTISGNKVLMGAVGGDGGVYCASNQVALKGGVIEKNEAERQGGGVYIGSIPYVLKIFNALVTSNTASIFGGGAWACPTGDTEIFVTNGAAVYGNSAKGAGDEIVSVKNRGQNYILTLAGRILGGGRVLWYEDGGSLGAPDEAISRYGPGGSAKPIAQIQNGTSPYALKAIVSKEAKALAAESAACLSEIIHRHAAAGLEATGIS